MDNNQLEKMAEERYPVTDVYGEDINDYERKIFIEGYKANNSLEELEKHINGLKSYTKAYTTENGIEWVRKDSILNKIQELKTKQ